MQTKVKGKEKVSMSTGAADDKAGNPSSLETSSEWKKPVGYFALFRYTTAAEKCFILAGVLLAIAHGITMPLTSVIFGNISKNLTPDKSPQDRRDAAITSAMNMFYLGLAAFAASFLSTAC